MRWESCGQSAGSIVGADSPACSPATPRLRGDTWRLAILYCTVLASYPRYGREFSRRMFRETIRPQLPSGLCSGTMTELSRLWPRRTLYLYRRSKKAACMLSARRNMRPRKILLSGQGLVGIWVVQPTPHATVNAHET